MDVANIRMRIAELQAARDAAWREYRDPGYDQMIAASIARLRQQLAVREGVAGC